MFLEELCKCRDRNVESVCTIVLLNAGQLGLLVDASAGLKLANGGLGLGVDGILEAAEGFGIRIVEETAFLEQE